MRIHGAVILSLALCVAVNAQVYAALTISGYSAATAGKYDRFANSPEFIGSAYDWSGVGRTSTGRWGVLISPSFMVSAAHFPPGLGNAVRFYTSNDPAGSFVERTVLSNERLNDSGTGVGSDLIITRLSAPATGVATYALGNPGLNLVGQEIYVWGQANNADPFLNMRLGRNQVTAVLPGFSNAGLNGTGDVFTYDYNPNTGLGADEARLELFDSGGPTFVNGPGGLALIGTHWFTYDANPMVPGSRSGSADTLVTSFIEQLNSAIARSGLDERVTVAAVPEPTSLTWLAVGLLFHRGRRSVRHQNACGQ